MDRGLWWCCGLAVLALSWPQAGCAGRGGKAPGPADVGERPVRRLPLTGDLSDRRAEISGFAWYGDALIVLPQRPTWNPLRGPGGCFYALPRTALERAAEGDPAPLLGRPLPLRGFEQVATLPGVQGFEAIVVRGERVFLLIEAQPRGEGMRGYLALGHVEGALDAITIEQVSPVVLPSQTDVVNIAYEALVDAPSGLWALYEANGALNPAPRAMRFDPGGLHAEALPFPRLEYRITDATPPEEDGRFWVINYFYPPEQALAARSDALSERFGLGPSQRPGSAVERLVRLRLSGVRFSLAPEPPVRLQLSDGAPRNWEALAVLPGKGFLLATDSHPETMLGFVAYP